MENLIIDSSASSTWSKHYSAWAIYDDFCLSHNIKGWPADYKAARAFATWALTTRNLKANTVKSYISSIGFKNSLCNFPDPCLLSDKIVKLILKGGQNRSLVQPSSELIKLSVNTHMLRVLGHRIAVSNWSPLSQQIVWTAFVTCFFSACRMGELVSDNDKNFDPRKTLKWSDLDFNVPDGMLMFLPYTKSKGAKGEMIDLFFYNSANFCPVSNLISLRCLLLQHNLYDISNPVFMFKSGRFLTKKILNGILDRMLSDMFDNKRFKVTCHSFRTGIPTLLDSLGTRHGEDIKEWGRWASNSVGLYTRNVRERRKTIYDNILNVLSDSL